jgi:hypothetical protein
VAFTASAPDFTAARRARNRSRRKPASASQKCWRAGPPAPRCRGDGNDRPRQA